jgi:C4-dicarboxylate-specific signal transduction histidine kinase
MVKLPAEAARDVENFRYFGIKSCLAFPLSLGNGPPIGVLGFNTMRAERTWPETIVKRLQLVTQIFTNALARERAERKLVKSEQRLRLMQDELLHAGRISTMGELAGALAHEINQPLSAIMSNAQAARRYLATPTPDLEEVKEILNDIVKDDARAGDVVHHLRAHLKKTKTASEPLDLNLIFREVVGLLRRDAVIRDVKVSSELDPMLPLVRGERIQLQQVALNLILNAFEAMNEQPNGDRQVLIRTGLKDARVLAAVTDNGNGIPIEDAEKIFNRFTPPNRRAWAWGCPFVVRSSTAIMAAFGLKTTLTAGRRFISACRCRRKIKS